MRASLVLIDGDHHYDAVVADIRALLAMPTRPWGVAFHDYSLRYATPESAAIRVDRALHDVLGADVRLTPIGEISREGGPLQTAPRPDDPHYHEIGVTDGVVVELRNLALQKARAGSAWQRLLGR